MDVKFCESVMKEMASASLMEVKCCESVMKEIMKDGENQQMPNSVCVDEPLAAQIGQELDLGLELNSFFNEDFERILDDDYDYDIFGDFQIGGFEDTEPTDLPDFDFDFDFGSQNEEFGFIDKPSYVILCHLILLMIQKKKNNNFEHTRAALASASAAPAPVVGWPSIRSLRKNLASNSSAKMPPESQNVVPDKVASEKPVGGCRKGLFVNINMDGVPIERKVDLKAYENYEKLSYAVDELFRGLLAVRMKFDCLGAVVFYGWGGYDDSSDSVAILMKLCGIEREMREEERG
ncbi:hypothetical protein F0562_034505 [Nyssa sinensis]|uniref:Auxin-responsive protein n=1 Tax=Nyssa sinensis TaxID=561372 RepID=A0A5J5AL76_9ASTE|nr:hypothetical protein F0562_034505 [Nyssa sinensis]